MRVYDIYGYIQNRASIVSVLGSMSVAKRMPSYCRSDCRRPQPAGSPAAIYNVFPIAMIVSSMRVVLDSVSQSRNMIRRVRGIHLLHMR